MENRLAIGTLVCVLSFIAPPVVHAELIPVKAEGRSVIKGGSRNACFESARVHALREAVEQVSDIELRSRTKVTNATDIKDRILVETRGYISKYRVLEKNVVGDECIVQVRAAINDIKVREAIDEAIANLMEQLDIPAMGATIRFTVDGRAIEPGNTDYDTQDALDALGEKLLGGYNIDLKDVGDAEIRFVDTSGKMSLKARKQLIRDIASQLPDEGNVDYLVMGEVRAKSAGRDSDSASYLSIGTTNLRIARLGGVNEFVGVINDNRTVRGWTQADANRKAMRYSIEYSVDKIAHQILKNFKKRTEAGQDFIVRLVGVKSNIRQVRPIKKSLKETMQYQSGKSGRRDGKKIYSMNVRFNGTVSEFEEGLMDALDPVVDRLVMDVEVSGNIATVYLK